MAEEVPDKGWVMMRMMELKEASAALQANVDSLQLTKCTFFSRCLRSVRFPFQAFQHALGVLSFSCIQSLVPLFWLPFKPFSKHCGSACGPLAARAMSVCVGCVCVQILRPAQVGTLLVQAYPFHPDVLAVLALVAEEAGEPPVEQLLAAGITAGAAPQLALAAAG